jgi:hypothetical protein
MFVMDHRTSAIIKVTCFFLITIIIGFVASDINILTSQ